MGESCWCRDDFECARCRSDRGVNVNLETYRMWGLRDQVDELREALEKIAEWTAEGVAGNVIPVIHRIAREALDKDKPAVRE
jgi:hypothetical protein